MLSVLTEACSHRRLSQLQDVVVVQRVRPAPHGLWGAAPLHGARRLSARHVVWAAARQVAGRLRLAHGRQRHRDLSLDSTGLRVLRLVGVAHLPEA